MESKKAKTSAVPPQNPPIAPNEVFVMGSGDCGQLGLGPDIMSTHRPKKLKYFDDKSPIAVSAGGLHNLVLTAPGKVYSWGCNDQSALGRDGDESLPGIVEIDAVVTAIACGDSISLALTDSGDVYAWGIFGFDPATLVQKYPTKIPLKDIISISAGSDHVYAIDKHEVIYSWGCGEQDQLGRRINARSEKETSLTPRVVYFKPPIRKLLKNNAFGHFKACLGGYHSFVIHKTGDLFAIGLNNYGQLGTGSDLSENQFVHIKEFVSIDDSGEEIEVESVGFESVASSSHHSIALDRNGRLFAFGRNDDGQLGLGSSKEPSVLVPRLLKIPQNVVKVSANSAFSLALTSPACGNNLWMWGYGDMGQLGAGEEETELDEPHQVELKGRCVYDASCGGQHTLLLLNAKPQ